MQPPSEANRHTCACKQHENMQYLVDALFNIKLLHLKRLHDVAMNFTCDMTNLNCMYGRCLKCNEVRLSIEVSGQKVDRNEETTFFQWKTKKESRLIKGEAKEITVTVREKITDKVDTLIDKFCQEMPRFKIHIYNIFNQLDHYRALKENLTKTEALIHKEFSENFQCKLSKEIQGMHFGASQRQITLHTGVYYTETENLLRCIRFCAT